MISEVLKDDYFSETEMSNILNICLSTLRQRRYTGRNHPPYSKEGAEILYPKSEFREWVKAKRVVYEVSRAS